MTPTPSTPAADGFAMPAEWEPHAACLMAWPSRPDLWGGRLDEAKRDYAAVAEATAVATLISALNKATSLFLTA